MEINKDFIVTPGEFNELVLKHMTLNKKVISMDPENALSNESISGSFIPNLEKEFIEYTLTGDTILNSPINVTKGKRGLLIIRQNEIAGHNLEINYDVFFSPSGEILISPDIGSEIVIEYTVITESRILLILKSDYNIGA